MFCLFYINAQVILGSVSTGSNQAIDGLRLRVNVILLKEAGALKGLNVYVVRQTGHIDGLTQQGEGSQQSVNWHMAPCFI